MIRILLRALGGGFRFAYVVDELARVYVGAAYEQEFSGEAGATVYGYNVNPAKMSGSTGMGELGLYLKYSETLPLYIDLGIQGYMGKKEGVLGSLQVRYEF